MKNNIAVLVINWNDYKNTKECLDSLIKNNPDNDFSIILLDNNSCDGSCEKLIKEYNLTTFIPSIWNCEKEDIFFIDENFNSYLGGNICIKLNQNYGFTGANNFGMKFAWQNKFKYIMRLNNDTIVNKHLFRELLKSSEEYPNSLISPTILYYPDTEYIRFLGGYLNWIGKPKSNFYRKKYKNLKLNSHLESILCSGCAMFYRREVLEKLGGQDNNYFFNLDDADYSYEAYKKGINTIVNTNVVLYHKSARSVAKTPGLAMYYYIRNVVYFRKKHFPWYRNIVIYIYIMVHMSGVILFFGFRGKNVIGFVGSLIKDIYNGTMGKFKNKK